MYFSAFCKSVAFHDVILQLYYSYVESLLARNSKDVSAYYTLILIKKTILWMLVQRFNHYMHIIFN